MECGNDLDIGRRGGGTEDFNTDLRELAIAAALHLLVAEHGTEVAQSKRLRPLTESIFDIGPGDARRSFRTQGQGASLAIGKGVHLLRDDVGPFTNAPDEELGGLHQRQSDLGVAKTTEDVVRGALDLVPQP